MLEITFDAIVSARVCYAAAKLRLADHIAAGHETSDELANSTGMNPRAMYRLLRALATVGVVEEVSGRRFVLTELGTTLRSDLSGSMRAWVEFSGEPYYLQSWVRIMESMQTGAPAFDRVHGVSFFEYLTNHPDHAAVFDEAMTSLTANEAPAIVAAYDFSQFERIVDIGGGGATLLMEILRAHDRVAGVVFDLAHVAERARVELAANGFDSRCAVVSGSFFESVPSGGDAYILKYILHDWDDTDCARILDRCRAAMDGQAKLVVVETVVPPAGVAHYAKLSDIEMLVLLGSQERTEDEYRALLSRSGFALTRVVPTTELLSVIEAELV
jgi:hypothetical protein